LLKRSLITGGGLVVDMIDYSWMIGLVAEVFMVVHDG
jgi:hypothetical protein